MPDPSGVIHMRGKSKRRWLTAALVCGNQISKIIFRQSYRGRFFQLTPDFRPNKFFVERRRRLIQDRLSESNKFFRKHREPI